MKSAFHAGLLAILAIVGTGACTSILGGFDYGGKGGGSSTSSSSGVIGTGGTTGTGGMTGTGGTTMCVACSAASNCTNTPSSDCAVVSCNSGCCGETPLPLDTTCATQGGKHCDGKGKCVACNVTSDCAASTTQCATIACDIATHMCVPTPTASGSSCNDSGGTLCDGKGSCVACLSSSSCAGTTCSPGGCSAGMCTNTPAPAGTTCAASGGTVCSGAGKCVACVKDGDCTPTGTVCATVACSATNTCDITDAAKGTPCTDNGGVVCDGAGKCAAMHCSDGVKDADETGKDCGGSCAPCAVGAGCKLATDCASGYCVGTPTGTCTACTADLQCASGSFCDPSNNGGTCTVKKPNAGTCAGTNQCQSGFCANGVCCDSTCNGTCQGCTMALTGVADGTCSTYVPGKAAPAGQCTVSGTQPCRNDGRCAAGGTCEQASTGTPCGTTCSSGTLTTNQCSGSGTCVAAQSVACSGFLECASGTSCLSNCSVDTDCASGYWCSAGACVAQGAPGSGATCTGNNQCTTGFCVDGYCCNTACNTACQTCGGGTCAAAPNGAVDPRGLCAATAQTTCGTDGKCSGGACRNWASGTDCTHVCSAGSQTTASCNGTGTCTAGAMKACSPYLCGAGACKTSCVTHADCIAGDFCWIGACVKDTAIAAGPGLSAAHTCALTSAGGMQCWGSGGSGQLGNGTFANSTVPVAVTGLSSGVTGISVGDVHTCAVVGGSVQCWGDNGNGQLGNNTATVPSSNVPISVSGLATGSVKSVAAGGVHSCVVTTAGGVQCWGYNGSGQLGNNSTTNSFMPVAVTGLSTGVQAVATGESHTCALTTAGGVQCWGVNTNGQLGNGTTSSGATTTPVQVQGLSSGIVAIAAGYQHTCAITSTGGVKCWGWGQWGQLGNNTTTNQQSTPVDVTGLTNVVVAIATGQYQTCAATQGGPVLCWGGNLDGSLGNNSTTLSSVPVASGSLTGGTVVAAGGFHSCAVTGTGTWCWGLDSAGQLGNNSTTQSLVPVPVAEP